MMTKCWRCKSDIDTMKVDTVETVGLCQRCWDRSSVEQDAAEKPIAELTDVEYVQRNIARALQIPKEHLGAPKVDPNPLAVAEDYFIPSKEQAFAEMKEEAAERKEKYQNSNISPEQYVHGPAWDDTEVRPKPPLEPQPKVFMEANYAALETRVVAQMVSDRLNESALPKKSDVDFVELQLENDPSLRGTRLQDDSGFGSPFHKTIGMARLEQDLADAISNASEKFRNKPFDEVRDQVRDLSIDVLIKNTPKGFPIPPRKIIEDIVDKCLDDRFGPRGSARSINFRV